jgi:hypothetical protein
VKVVKCSLLGLLNSRWQSSGLQTGDDSAPSACHIFNTDHDGSTTPLRQVPMDVSMHYIHFATIVLAYLLQPATRDQTLPRLFFPPTGHQFIPALLVLHSRQASRRNLQQLVRLLYARVLRKCDGNGDWNRGFSIGRMKTLDHGEGSCWQHSSSIQCCVWNSSRWVKRVRVGVDLILK